jgi:hypothetical protein
MEFQVLIWDKHMIVAVLNRLMESQFSSLDSQDWVAQTSIKFKSQLNIKWSVTKTILYGPKLDPKWHELFAILYFLSKIMQVPGRSIYENSDRLR